MPIRIAAAGLGTATHSVPRGLARWTGRTLRVDIEGRGNPQLPVSAADETGRQVAAALARDVPAQAASPGSAARPRPYVLTPNQDTLAAVARGRPLSVADKCWRLPLRKSVGPLTWPSARSSSKPFAEMGHQCPDSASAGRLEAFALGADNALLTISQNAPGGWVKSSWQPLRSYGPAA
jgi:hypothetical protein